MAEELDSKNLDNGGINGQMSLGEDSFYQKYEQKIQLSDGEVHAAAGAG